MAPLQVEREILLAILQYRQDVPIDRISEEFNRLVELLKPCSPEQSSGIGSKS